MLVSQIQQAPTPYLLEVEVLEVASLEAEVAAVSEPFKESCHRLKKYAIMEDRKKGVIYVSY